jgi:hypothetical protein
MTYEICGADDATHVRILAGHAEELGLTYDTVYELRRNDVCGMYVINDEGIGTTFSRVTTYELLRKNAEIPAHEPPAYVRRAIAEYTDAGIARKYIVDPVFRTDYASDRERAIGEYGWRHFDELIAYLYDGKFTKGER